MSHSTAINQTAPITSEQGKPQSTFKYGLATVDDLHVRRVERSSGSRVTLRELYGLSNIDALSDKRKRIPPSKARAYDLLNFASEIATHHAAPTGANRIQAYIGTLISDEYDLEGTAEKSTDFDAFFMDKSAGRPSN